MGVMEAQEVLILLRMSAKKLVIYSSSIQLVEHSRGAANCWAYNQSTAGHRRHVTGGLRQYEPTHEKVLVT